MFDGTVEYFDDDKDKEIPMMRKMKQKTTMMKKIRRKKILMKMMRKMMRVPTTVMTVGMLPTKTKIRPMKMNLHLRKRRWKQ